MHNTIQHDLIYYFIEITRNFYKLLNNISNNPVEFLVTQFCVYSPDHEVFGLVMKVGIIVEIFNVGVSVGVEVIITLPSILL